MNELRFYFVNTDFLVTVKLPHNFEIQSARNVFMIDAKQDILGLRGQLVFAFGLNHYMMLHIDSELYQ